MHRGPQPADDVNHKNEQQENLCRVIEKELDGIPQWSAFVDGKKIIGQPLRKQMIELVCPDDAHHMHFYGGFGMAEATNLKLMKKRL